MRRPPNHIAITVNGNSYKDVRSAWQAESPEGLPEITVRKRLESGWDIDEAFNTLPIEPSLRRLGHD